MRYPDGSLIGDFNDSFNATTSSSLLPTSASRLDENQTVYDLLPVVVNQPPILTVPIVDGSQPQIKQIGLADGTGQKMYLNEDGVVRVCVNTTITLSMTGVQPNVYNVENGVLQIIPNQTNLVYQWKLNESVIAPFSLLSLQSELSIDRNTLTISNVQIQHSGTYTCEVSNDIGTLVSEPIQIEVYDPEADPLIFRNLIENGFGEDGVDGWNSTSATEFLSKEMSLVHPEQLKIVSNNSLFGYTSDMMHPRPYQIETGPLVDVDFHSKLTVGGNYFSRSNYRLLTMGGSNLVKAYQDIDVSELGDVIKGGVYGVEGLRAVFGCYIGQAISNYRPTVQLTPIKQRTKRREFFFGAPRLSVENWFSAGFPEIIDKVYVTVEEFDNETKLISSLRTQDGTTQVQSDVITIRDPYTVSEWNGRYYPGSQRYPEDVFELEAETPGGPRDQILHRADSLMPDYSERFTFGQYIQFNRIILDKLNPKTTKIRVSIVFECDDYRILDPTAGAKELSGDVKDYIGWETPAEKNTFGEVESPSINDILTIGSGSVPPSERYLQQGEPRPMVTGLCLGLIPVLNYSSESIQLTEQLTNNTLAQNNLPTAAVGNTLLPIPFDPFGRRNRELEVSFYNDTVFSSSSRDLTAIELKVIPRTGSSWMFDPSQSLFPFTSELPVDMHIGNAISGSQALKNWRVVSSRRGAQTTQGSYGSVPATPLPLLSERFVETSKAIETANLLGSDYYSKAINVAGANGNLGFDENGSLSTPREWNNTSRFIVHYTARKKIDSGSSFIQYGRDNRTLNTSGVGSANFTEKINQLDKALRYNSYIVEIAHPSTHNTLQQSSVTIFRPADLVGSGSLSPIQLEHGVTDNKFYFRLPEQLLTAKVAEGGLGMGSEASLVARDVIVPRAQGFPIDFLLLNSHHWWRLGESYGDQARRRLIDSVFPSTEERLSAIPVISASLQISQTDEINEADFLPIPTWRVLDTSRKPKLPFPDQVIVQSGAQIRVSTNGSVLSVSQFTPRDLTIRARCRLSLRKLINLANSANYAQPTNVAFKLRRFDNNLNGLDMVPVVQTIEVPLSQTFSQTNTQFEQDFDVTFNLTQASGRYAISLDFDQNQPILLIGVDNLLNGNISDNAVNTISVVNGSVDILVSDYPPSAVTEQTTPRQEKIASAKQRLYELLSIATLAYQPLSSIVYGAGATSIASYFASASAVLQPIYPVFSSQYNLLKQQYQDLWGDTGQSVLIRQQDQTRYICNFSESNPADSATYLLGVISGSLLFNYGVEGGELYSTLNNSTSSSLELGLSSVNSGNCILAFPKDAVLTNFSEQQVDLGVPSPIEGFSRNYDYAASLYAVQATNYSFSEGAGFGGTPVFGYDQARFSYNVTIKPIIDNIIRDTTPIPNPVV